jgi:hypothetical protein
MRFLSIYLMSVPISRFVLFMLVCSIASSCAHRYYTPDTISMPWMPEKHDISATGALIAAGGQSGYQASVAYRPHKFVALTLSHMTISASDAGQSAFVSEGGTGYNRLTQIGAGFYTTRKRMAYSLMGGYGQGVSVHNLQEDARVKLHLNRFFIQPAVLWNSEWFYFGGGTRLIRLDYPQGEVNLEFTSQFLGATELTAIRNIDRESPFWMGELYMQGGVNHGNFSVGLALHVLTKRHFKDYYFQNASISANFGYRLSGLFSKQSKK